MRLKWETSAWWTGLTLLLTGFAALPVNVDWGGRCVAWGGALLVLRALAHVHGEAGRSLARMAALMLAQAGCLVAAALATGVVPIALSWTTKAVVAALAAQLALGALGVLGAMRPARRVLLALGHAGALGATWTLATGAAAPAVLALAYSASFAGLALGALWPRREALLPWEPLLLASLALSPGAASFAFILQEHGRAAPFALLLAAAAGLVAFSLLAAPPNAPARLRRADPLAAAAMQGFAFLAILNALFLPLAAFLVAGARAAVLVLTAVVAVAALLEYAAVRHQVRMRRAYEAAAPVALDAPVTVVVPARNEAETLRRSIEENLALPAPVRFLLVPSASSTDGTVEVAREAAARHPDRVRVHLGVSGSKAGDLNDAWRTLETDLVLVLDADETIDEASLARGVRTLRETPSAGLVQGRKVSSDPEGGALARFIATERRHSTGLDHPLYADRFRAGHFAGSAALLRREVPPALGGWSEDALTEDIDLTLRIHLETDWGIVYDARMVVRESDPTDLRQLLRQRTRWARGWAECFARYTPLLPARRARLGTGRALALGWMLFAAVSAPLFSLFPALLLLRLAGSDALPPLWVALPLALLVLPARLVSHVYGALTDPVTPVPRTPGRLAELVMHAYAWVAFGWVVQFHAAYLALADAPRVWSVTQKRNVLSPASLLRRPVKT